MVTTAAGSPMRPPGTISNAIEIATIAGGSPTGGGTGTPIMLAMRTATIVTGRRVMRLSTGAVGVVTITVLRSPGIGRNLPVNTASNDVVSGWLSGGGSRIQ